jgi:uncharacterized RDD family membrane protein YckC
VQAAISEERAKAEAAARPEMPAAPASREIHAAPASWWRRTIASVVDAALLTALWGVLLGLASKVAAKPPALHTVAGDAFGAQLAAFQALLLPAAGLAIILAVVYATVFGIVGRSPGRLVAGLKLVDKSGLAPTPLRAAFRAVLAIPSFALFLAGFWLALVDRHGQTLHDKISRTFVVRPL